MENVIEKYTDKDPEQTKKKCCLFIIRMQEREC